MDYDNDTHDAVPEYVRRIIEQRDAYKTERDAALALVDSAGQAIDRLIALIELLSDRAWTGPRWAEISKGLQS